MPPSGRMFLTADLRVALRRAKERTPPLDVGEFGGEQSCTWDEFSELSRIPRNMIHNVFRRNRVNEWTVDAICTRLGIDYPTDYFREEVIDGPDIRRQGDLQLVPEGDGTGAAVGLHRGQSTGSRGESIAA